MNPIAKIFRLLAAALLPLARWLEAKERNRTRVAVALILAVLILDTQTPRETTSEDRR